MFINERWRLERRCSIPYYYCGWQWGTMYDERSDCDGSNFHFNERRNAQLHDWMGLCWMLMIARRCWSSMVPGGSHRIFYVLVPHYLLSHTTCNWIKESATWIERVVQIESGELKGTLNWFPLNSILNFWALQVQVQTPLRNIRSLSCSERILE